MPFLRPDSDNLTTGWTDQAAGTTNLYQTIDETSASDADYVRSPNNPGSSDIVRFGLSNPGVVVDTAQPVTIRVRHRFDAVSNTVVVRLNESTFTRAARTFNSIGSSFATSTITLTEAEKSSITNWDNLFIEIEAVDSSLIDTTLADPDGNTLQDPDTTALEGP